jgi:hypothetical protein
MLLLRSDSIRRMCGASLSPLFQAWDRIVEDVLTALDSTDSSSEVAKTLKKFCCSTPPFVTSFLCNLIYGADSTQSPMYPYDSLSVPFCGGPRHISEIHLLY